MALKSSNLTQTNTYEVEVEVEDHVEEVKQLLEEGTT